MESPPSGAGLTSSGHWESPGAEGSACLVSSLCTRRHLVPQSELAVNTKRCSKYLEQWSPPTAFSKGQPLLCPQAHSLSTGLCGATWAAMWCSTDGPIHPQLLNAPCSAFCPSLSHPFFILSNSPKKRILSETDSFSGGKMRCQKISYVPLKNQIRPGNNSERFVFLKDTQENSFR